jgi:hypothetical protein
MNVVRRVVADENERKRVELCLKVMECVECFNVKTFLLSFARTREDEVIRKKVFAVEKKRMAVARRSCRAVLFTAIGNQELVAIPQAPPVAGQLKL